MLGDQAEAWGELWKTVIEKEGHLHLLYNVTWIFYLLQYSEGWHQLSVVETNTYEACPIERYTQN